MNLNKNSVLGVLTSGHEENIIMNPAQIPTVVINPIDSPYGSSIMFG